MGHIDIDHSDDSDISMISDGYDNNGKGCFANCLADACCFDHHHSTCRNLLTFTIWAAIIGYVVYYGFYKNNILNNS